jgi:ABC-type Fe3+-siderophore transport system permease subunit
VLLVSPAILIGAGAVRVRSRELDALLLGEVAAQSIGADVPHVVRLVLVTLHILRLAVGSTHPGLLPARFVARANRAALTRLAPMEIPAGVITAAVGTPLGGRLPYLRRFETEREIEEARR